MHSNLNDIRNQLAAFFQGHAQVNTVKAEDGFDFAAERDLAYPVARIEYVDTRYSEKMASHQFEVTLSDLADENVPGIENEIYSDLLEVADDFAAWLWDQGNFAFDRRMQIQKFVDQKGDRTAGITVVVNLSAMLRGNPCQTPTKN